MSDARTGSAGGWVAAVLPGLLVAVLALAGPAASALAGQEAEGVVSPATLDAARERFEAVDERYRWASRRVETREQREAARQRDRFDGLLDSARVGPFVVVARTGELERGLSIVRSAWQDFSTLHAGAAPPQKGRSFTLVLMHPEDSLRQVMESPYHAFTEESWAAARFRWGPPRVRDMARILHQATPSSVRAWITPEALRPSFNWSQAGRAFLLSRSPRTPPCAEGLLQACLDVLGLPEPPMSPGAGSEAGTREFIRIQQARLRRVYPGVSWDRVAASFVASGLCNPSTTAAVCRERLSHPRNRALVHPLARPARDALFRTALDMGGPEGIYRLTSLPETASLQEALEATAQAPLDRIVTNWRERLVTQDLGDRPLPAPAGPLLWTAVMGLFALRSTRWRAA